MASGYRKFNNGTARRRGFPFGLIFTLIAVLLVDLVLAWGITALITGNWFPEPERPREHAEYVGANSSLLAPRPKDPTAQEEEPEAGSEAAGSESADSAAGSEADSEAESESDSSSA